MKVVYLSDIHKRSWEELVCCTPESGFMQSWYWSKFKEIEGQKVLRMGIFDNGNLIGGSMVYYVPTSLGCSPLELPHGPVLPWTIKSKAKECMEIIRHELIEISKRTGSPIARIEPFIIGQLPEYMGDFVCAPLDLIPTPTLLISLDGNDSEILSSMTQKGRYNIKYALKIGVEVLFSNKIEAVDDFYPLFELTFNKHNFQGEPCLFFKNMIKCLGPIDMARVYFASYKGIMISGAIAVFYGDRATYLYGGSLPFLSKTMASYALHWKIMSDARSLGYRFYDFYGIAPEGQIFHPYVRFTQFKLRFGGTKISTVGAQDIYFYPQLAEMWAKNLETVTSF